MLTSDPVAASATPTSENEAEFLMESYGGKVPDYPFIGELSRDQVEETVNTLKIQGYTSHGQDSSPGAPLSHPEIAIRFNFLGGVV